MTEQEFREKEWELRLPDVENRIAHDKVRVIEDKCRAISYLAETSKHLEGFSGLRTEIHDKIKTILKDI